MVQQVARLHLLPNSAAPGVGAQEIFRFCFTRKIIGMGWDIGPSSKTETTFDYYAARADPKSIKSVKPFHDLENGDLVWIKNAHKEYFISEVRGPWEYCWTEENKIVDIFHVRSADIRSIPNSEITKGIRDAFTPSTFQMVRNREVVNRTISLWNEYFR